MPAFTLKLIAHAWNAIATLLSPQKMASHAGLLSLQPLGAVTTPQSGKSSRMARKSSCEWSIVVDDPITGEPRGLIFTSESLSENEALTQAQCLLLTYRVIGTFIKPAHAERSETTGLYLFYYHLANVKKLGTIWAHSLDDASNTLSHMAECGNLLCYCEPEQ